MAEKKKVLDTDILQLHPLQWVVAETSVPMPVSLTKVSSKQLKHNPEMTKAVKRLIDYFKNELPPA